MGKKRNKQRERERQVVNQAAAAESFLRALGITPSAAIVPAPKPPKPSKPVGRSVIVVISEEPVEPSFEEMVNETLDMPECAEKSGIVKQSFEKRLVCREPGCPEFREEGEKYCPLHAELHADDEKAKAAREAERAERADRAKRAKAKVGTRRELTEAEREQKNLERARREAERKARQLEVSQQGPKGTAVGKQGGGGKPTTNPNSKTARKKRRKEEQRKGGHKKK